MFTAAKSKSYVKQSEKVFQPHIPHMNTNLGFHYETDYDQIGCQTQLLKSASKLGIVVRRGRDYPCEYGGIFESASG